MSIIKKYDLKGKETGELKIGEELLKSVANSQMVKDYIVALRANARQWSASTKTRAEVNHSGQKPHPQKGMGRARQGYLGAPQYKGGGRPGGPRPKFDQHVKMNRKEKKSVIRQLLIEKVADGKVHVLEFEAFKNPKTSTVATFLSQLNLADKRVLFLAEGPKDNNKEAPKKTSKAKKKTSVSPMEKYDVWTKSMRNIPRKHLLLTPNVSGYDLIASHDIVIMDGAVDDFMTLLGD